MTNSIVLTLLVIDLTLLLPRVVGCDLQKTLDVPQEGLCGGDTGVHADPNTYPRRNSSRRCRRGGKRRVVDCMLGVTTRGTVQTPDLWSVA